MAPTVAPPALPDRESPLFDSKDVTVVFVLGGPGSGKGTQSNYIVRDYHFNHLSAGDLLREEQDREGSPYGDLIKHYIVEGTIVPMEVTVVLLENAMKRIIESGGPRRFLIDGFPRKLDQAVAFEKVVCQSSFVLFFEADEAVLESRLLNRGKTSGRADDNLESIKKRFKTFHDTTMPVVDEFQKEGKVSTVNANQTPQEVYASVREIFAERGIQMPELGEQELDFPAVAAGAS